MNAKEKILKILTSHRQAYIPLIELAEESNLSKPYISNVLSEMKNLGLVSNQTDPDNPNEKSGVWYITNVGLDYTKRKIKPKPKLKLVVVNGKKIV